MAIPKKDVLLVAFSSNFNTRINASYGLYQLDESQATAYTALHNPYVNAVSALNVARESGTRSEALRIARDDAKAALLVYARELYSIIQANTSVSDENKSLLGIHIRDNTPTPVPAPSVAPSLTVLSVFSRTVKIDIFDMSSSTRRAKVPGAVGAYVYTFVGEDYPTDPTLWQFQGNATRGTYEVTFPDTVANGTPCWITAAWVNRRGETGPVVPPTQFIMQGGLSMAA